MHAWIAPVTAQCMALTWLHSENWKAIQWENKRVKTCMVQQIMLPGCITSKLLALCIAWYIGHMWIVMRHCACSSRTRARTASRSSATIMRRRWRKDMWIHRDAHSNQMFLTISSKIELEWWSESEQASFKRVMPRSFAQHHSLLHCIVIIITGEDAPHCAMCQKCGKVFGNHTSSVGILIQIAYKDFGSLGMTAKARAICTALQSKIRHTHKNNLLSESECPRRNRDCTFLQVL